jgi:magnesium transporter
MRHHNFLAIPVVDSDNKLLGIVTHDDILDVIQDEATEDLQKLVGAGGDEELSDDILYAVQKRAPWLMINLLTSCLAAGVIYHYQSMISEFTLLAVFLPIVANIAGNTGSQTLAVAIRSLSTGLIGKKQGNLVWLCLREAAKGVLSGLPVSLLAVALAIGVSLFAGNDFTYSLRLGGTLIFAMQCSMAMSSFTGVFVPLKLRSLGLDPAQSASIFLTAFTDMAGFFLFLKAGILLLT